MNANVLYLVALFVGILLSSYLQTRNIGIAIFATAASMLVGLAFVIIWWRFVSEGDREKLTDKASRSEPIDWGPPATRKINIGLTVICVATAVVLDLLLKPLWSLIPGLAAIAVNKYFASRSR